MKKHIVNAFLAGLLALGTAALAQDLSTPASTTAPAAETPASQPAPVQNAPQAPDVNVRVEAPPAAPPSTVILERSKPDQSSTSTNHSSTSVETHTVAQPSNAGVDPWIILAVALGALVLIVSVVAMSSRDRTRTSSHTIVR